MIFKSESLFYLNNFGVIINEHSLHELGPRLPQEIKTPIQRVDKSRFVLATQFLLFVLCQVVTSQFMHGQVQKYCPELVSPV